MNSSQTRVETGRPVKLFHAQKRCVQGKQQWHIREVWRTQNHQPWVTGRCGWVVGTVQGRRPWVACKGNDQSPRPWSQYHQSVDFRSRENLSGVVQCPHCINIGFQVKGVSMISTRSHY